LKTKLYIEESPGKLLPVLEREDIYEVTPPLIIYEDKLYLFREGNFDEDIFVLTVPMQVS
jgi:hypothetical protein